MTSPTLEDLAKRITAAPLLAPFRDRLLGRVRPAIDIALGPGTGASLPVGASKFGGAPDLPAGTSWPRWRDRPRVFLGQIDLADVAPLEGGRLLPRSGLVSMFYTYDPHEGVFVREEGSWLTLHTPAGTALERLEEPDDLELASRAERGLTFADALDLPYDGFQFADDTLDPDPWASVWDAYGALHEWLHPAAYYLLGYPAHCTLAYDPTPGPEWRSLITLGSDDALGWCWGDGDRLMAFIRTSDLDAGVLTGPVRVDEG